jgi:hypothetical protein
VAGSGEQSNKISSSIKRGKFLQNLKYYQVLRKDYALLSYNSYYYLINSIHFMKENLCPGTVTISALKISND